MQTTHAKLVEKTVKFTTKNEMSNAKRARTSGNVV